MSKSKSMSKSATLDDPAVDAAIKQLDDAIHASAARAGVNVGSTAIVINQSDAMEAATDGCRCENCAQNMAATLLRAMGATKIADQFRATVRETSTRHVH